MLAELGVNGPIAAASPIWDPHAGLPVLIVPALKDEVYRLVVVLCVPALTTGFVIDDSPENHINPPA